MYSIFLLAPAVYGRVDKDCRTGILYTSILSTTLVRIDLPQAQRKPVCRNCERGSVGGVRRPAPFHQRDKDWNRRSELPWDGWTSSLLKRLIEHVKHFRIVQVLKLILPRRLARRQLPHHDPKAVDIHSRSVLCIPTKHLWCHPQLSPCSSGHLWTACLERNQ